MKILLTHPFSWPYVRRGSERFLHELSHYLASRGHDVTVLTSTAKATEEVCRQDRLITIRKPQIAGAVKLMRIAPEKSFLIRCLPFMLENRFDITHCLYFYDGCAAGLVHMISRKRYIVHVTGIPIKRFYRRRPWDYAALKFALSQAAEVIVPSQLALEYLETQFGYRASLLPPPCDINRFPLATRRDLDHPRILSLGDFGERRKGARVLLAAFHLLKKHVPTAVLQYSGDMPSAVRAELAAASTPEVLKDVEFLGRGNVDDLPALYAGAAVTVLASLLDVFGMVLIESLACGTPIVATRHGALPEILVPDVGALFDPGSTTGEATNAEGLCAAILETLALHHDPQLPYRCRRRAEDFGWDVVGPRYEDMYRRQVA
jgi:phosphatidylinositol alpha-mannosyltransferase